MGASEWEGQKEDQSKSWKPGERSPEGHGVKSSEKIRTREAMQQLYKVKRTVVHIEVLKA